MRLRIWHKMIIGVAIPSMIALIGGMLTFGYVRNIETRQDYEQIADEIKDQVLEVRREEKIFFHFKNAEHLNSVHKSIKVLENAISSVSEQVLEEIGIRDITALEASIISYTDYLDALYENFHKESEVTEKVRNEGRKLEDFVSKESHAKELTTSFVLHLRLLEKNYMLFRNRKSLDELNAALSKFKNVTPLCYECIPYTKAVQHLIETYKRSDFLMDQLQVVGNRLEEITLKMAVRERQRIGAFLAKTQRLLLIALVLLCIIGPLFVYKTASYVVAPINRLAKITRQISEGDMKLRAPLREHDETYDLSKSFNSMLDKLQLTHRSLEKSMELLREKQTQLIESEKRASLGLLVSGVAHELNNPLNNISIIAERMYEEREDLSPDEVRGFNNILMQCDRAKHIVDNLLDFARARKSTVMERQDIVMILNESFNLVGNQLRINNIDLIKDIPEEPIFINGNRSKLEQILVSIFTNAIQAMKPSGTLSVGLEADNENKNVRIRVCDTGPGISDEDVKSIFEPFFTTKPVGEGTGLGLSVCHSLVQEHRGTIEVDSRVGDGTIFTIRFPLYEEPAAG